jgi:hypothetical protein
VHCSRPVDLHACHNSTNESQQTTNPLAEQDSKRMTSHVTHSWMPQ